MLHGHKIPNPNLELFLRCHWGVICKLLHSNWLPILQNALLLWPLRHRNCWRTLLLRVRLLNNILNLENIIVEHSGMVQYLINSSKCTFTKLLRIREPIRDTIQKLCWWVSRQGVRKTRLAGHSWQFDAAAYQSELNKIYCNFNSSKNMAIVHEHSTHIYKHNTTYFFA